MSFLDLIGAPDRTIVRVVELQRKNRSTGAVDTLRYSDNRLASLPTDSPADTLYSNQLLDPGNYSQNLRVPGVPGLIGPLGAGTGGTLRIAQDCGNLDADFNLNTYAFDGLEARLYTTGYSSRLTTQQLPRADWRVRRMCQGRPRVGLDEVFLPLSDPMAFLNDPLQTRVFRGTGYCLNLQSGSSVGFGSPAALDTTDLTLSGWLWAKAISGAQRLVTWDNSATTYSYELRINSSGQLWFNSSNYSSPLTSTTTLVAAEWYHIAVTRSGAAITFHIYRESNDTGVVEAATASTPTPATSDGTLSMGRSSGGFVGMLDSWSVYSTARSKAEIQDVRLRPFISTDLVASLEAHWPLSETSGTSVPDSTSNSVDGTIAGSVDWFPSLEGDVDLQGTQKPDVWGRADHVPCPIVDALTEIRCAHGGTAHALAPYEGGHSLTLGTAYTDLLLFLGATTVAGRYDTYLNGPNGAYFRLGSSPSLPVASAILGEAGGTGFVDTPGQIAEKVVTTRGRSPLTSGDLDTAAWTALKSAQTNWCYYVAEPGDKIGDLLQALLGDTAGANYTMTNAGKLTVARWEGVKPGGSSVLTLSSRNIEAGSLRSIDSTAQLWKITALCYRNHLVLSRNQLNALLASASGQLFAEREFATRFHQDSDTYETHGEAEELTVEMRYLFPDAAYAECVRRLALFKEPPLAYTLVADTGGIEVEPLDTVTLELDDLGANQSLQPRLWTSGGMDFTVFGVVPVDPGAGQLTRLVIYREKSI